MVQQFTANAPDSELAPVHRRVPLPDVGEKHSYFFGSGLYSLLAKNHAGWRKSPAHRRLVKDAVEAYLELLTDELAVGEWVDIHGIGKMQVTVEDGSGASGLCNHPRLRTKTRLTKPFKAKRYTR